MVGFRYRKRIRLGGLGYINLSKQGLHSLSIGKAGATINIGKKGVKGTVGLPGTGLSYSKTMHSSGRSSVPLGEDDDFFDSGHSKRESYEAEERREKLEEFLNLKEQIKLTDTRFFWNSKKKYIFNSSLNLDNISAEQKKYYIANIITALSSADGNMATGGDSVYPLTVPVRELAGNLSESQIKGRQLYNHQAGIRSLVLCMLGIAFIFWIWNWIGTIIGLIMVPVFWMQFYRYLQYKHTYIFAKAQLVFNEMVKKKEEWEQGLIAYRKSRDEFIEKIYNDAVSGANKYIDEAIPEILSDVPSRKPELLFSDEDEDEENDESSDKKEVALDVALSESGSLLINLYLPNKEYIVTSHQLTATGKVSAIDKTGKQMNIEFLTCVLNYSFLILSEFYSAYPKVNNIKLAGFTDRNNEVTGNPESAYILYMNSERTHFSNVDFNNVNIIKLAEHLGYNINIDGRNGYLREVDIEDEDMVQHITNEI